MQHETHTEHNHEHSHGETHAHHNAGAARVKSSGLSTQAAILIGAAIIAGSLILHGVLASKGGSSSNLALLESFGGRAPGTNDYIYGKKNSKVYLIEYSDTECPYCMAFHNAVTQIQQKYGDKIGFIYRHFPLTSIHPDAMPEAIKMTCVGKLKGDTAYYDFMTTLFDYKIAKKVNKIDETFVSEFLSKNSIDKAAFDACIQDPATKATIEESIADGAQAGVNGTPTSYVVIKDGDSYQVLKRFEGAAQFNLIAPLIEKALKL